LFNDLLEAHGYKPLPSRSGVEALELARLHKPDLIVMDIQLPDVSGLQVTQWIKENGGGTYGVIPAFSQASLRAFPAS
jgi:two-component system, cell cycle response regulator DivK